MIRRIHMNKITTLNRLTFLPLTVPGTYGFASGLSGVSKACLLICSINFFLFKGPVGSLVHS